MRDRRPGGTAGDHPIAERVHAMVESVKFSPVRWGTGYDMDQVDHFLDDLIVLVRNGHPIESPVALVQFRPSKLREGYHVGEVDDFLDEVVATVAALVRGEEPEAARRAQSPEGEPPTLFESAPSV
ncbi:MAG TPA: DivIVA domain-containing protein, partial [Nocardioides sp.]